jgi:hypothetical protein
MTRSIGSFAVAMLLALTTTARAEKVDWSDYIEKRPAATAKQPAAKQPVKAKAVTRPAQPAKTTKAVATKAPVKAKPKAQARRK